MLSHARVVSLATKETMTLKVKLRDFNKYWGMQTTLPANISLEEI
jgi:hypothetical protein